MPDWFYAVGNTRSGPHSDDEMRDLAQAGRIGAGALCWNPEYGEAWRPLAQTPFATRGGAHQPGRITNAYVWIYAFVPLIGSGVETLLGLAGVVSDSVSNGLIVVYAVVYGVLARVDANQINEAYATRDRPRLSPWWFFLAPVYLWRRATYARQSRRHFWVWCAAFVLSAGVLFAPNIKLWLAGGLPECQSSQAQLEVLKLANTLDPLKTAGKTAVSLTQQSQTGLTDTLRSCSGSLRLSDGTEHPTTFSFEKRPNNVYVRIEVH